MQQISSAAFSDTKPHYELLLFSLYWVRRETRPIKHLRGYVNFWEIFLSRFISRITRLCICSILG